MSSTERHEKTIGERVFSTYRLPPKKAINLKFRVTKVFGEPLLGLIESFTGTPEDVEMDFSGVLKGVDPDMVTDMLVELCQYAKVDGKNVIFDITFADSSMIEIYEVAFWVLEVNFKDFLDELRGSLGGLVEKAMSLLPSVE